jgi:S-adenosylmethionine synthetase
MLIRNGLFTSESVSEGHPDKMADQISDAIVDAFLARDPRARVACETLLSNGLVVLAGEFKTRVPGLYDEVRGSAEAIARGVIRRIGYREAATGIDPDSCEVLVRFNRQSEDISRGVDRADAVLGAGDQGMMFGYACRETPVLMPLPITLAHHLVRRQAQLRKSGVLPWLRPDGKSQVSVRYADRQPLSVEAVVLSTQHAEGIELPELQAAVKRQIVAPVLEEAGYRMPERVLVNPTGRFVTGGPKGDTGLTGRKIIVDTYGGAAPHGGGAFSGKDPSKVDRSASYMARFLAKQVVARGWAERCLIQISYAIGVADPVSFVVETYDTGVLEPAEIERRLTAEFDLTPGGIISRLDLLRPIYEATAAYGHFGRDDLDLPWERVV